jgi:hypothetical protein
MNTLETPSTRLLRRVRYGMLPAVLAAVLVTTVPAGASPGPDNAQRQAVAHREVATLLQRAPLPAGTRQISAASAETIAPFRYAKTITLPANQVGATRFYIAPSATTALDWLKSQHLEGHSATAIGTSGAEHTQAFLLNRSSYFLQPKVVYIALVKSDGTLEFSVSASVWWEAQRTPAMAGGASRLTVKLNRGLNAPTAHRTQSAATSTVSLINAVISRVNALQVASPLPRSCPNDVGSSLSMSFYRKGSAQPYATVTVDPSGCGVVTITQYNADHVITSTGDVSEGHQLSDFVAPRLGLTDVAPA